MASSKSHNEKSADSPAPQFVTLEQAVTLLGGGVALRSIRWWIQQGKLASYKPGKKVLLDREELLQLIRASKRPAFAAEKAAG